MATGRDDVRRAVESVYQQLTVADGTADTYLTNHAWSNPSPGRWTKGGTVGATADTALVVELMA
jgi:hypothetical protein